MILQNEKGSKATISFLSEESCYQNVNSFGSFLNELNVFML